MNKKQYKALKDLEFAFYKCKQTGIRFICMGEDLKALTGKIPMTGDRLKMLRDKEDDGTIESVNAHKTILDSGGF